MSENAFKYSVLASGSTGNSFYVETPQKRLLIDAGLTGKKITSLLADIDRKPEDLDAILITHEHSDHILGAVWVIRRIASLMNKDIYAGEFHIYCHDVACEIIEMMAQMLLTRDELSQYGKRILLHEVHDGEQVNFLNMKLTAFDIRSRKAKQFGYRLRFANRRTLVCLGDEPYNERCRAYAEKADWLVSEAFCLDADAERFRPHEKGHGTVREAAISAEKLSVKNLVLFHTEDTAMDSRKERYTAEAAEHFKGGVFVPDDLDRIDID